MRIDRLLSIVVYLLNRELVPASVLSKRFGVSVRTIQRDMEAIDLAGIPIYAEHGAKGGYGIVDSFRLDRQLLTPDDVYYIITALRGVGATLDDPHPDETREKIKTLVSRNALELFSEREEKLSIDFSLLGNEPWQRQTFRIIRRSVEEERLVRFRYTSSRLEATVRVVEPMTIAFRWRSWYLYAWCRLRSDYRLFKISRIQEAQMPGERFRRRSRTFADFVTDRSEYAREIHMVIDFAPTASALVEECFPPDVRTVLPDGTVRVSARVPDDDSFYLYLLSYGNKARVVSPAQTRRRMRALAESVAAQYSGSV